VKVHRKTIRGPYQGSPAGCSTQCSYNQGGEAFFPKQGQCDNGAKKISIGGGKSSNQNPRTAVVPRPGKVGGAPTHCLNEREDFTKAQKPWEKPQKTLVEPGGRGLGDRPREKKTGSRRRGLEENDLTDLGEKNKKRPQDTTATWFSTYGSKGERATKQPRGAIICGKINCHAAAATKAWRKKFGTTLNGEGGTQSEVLTVRR